jgi:hypothetical protein
MTQKGNTSSRIRSGVQDESGTQGDSLMKDTEGRKLVTLSLQVSDHLFVDIHKSYNVLFVFTIF